MNTIDGNKKLFLITAAAIVLAGCGGSTGEAGLSSTEKEAVPAMIERAATVTTATTVTHETPVPINDASGTLLSFSSSGTLDLGNVFFTPLGNGRACSTCHQEGQAWTVTPAALQARFAQSKGADPIFLLVDGANSPNAPVATPAQKQGAYSMLLTKALIRVGLPIPTGAEFRLVQVDDPYGFASAAQLSLFRRPLPTANLKFNSTVMWDGRETLAAGTGGTCTGTEPAANCYVTLGTDLAAQANTAAQTHAQLVGGLTAAQQQAVLGFETGVFVAQASDNAAGSLAANGAKGGAQNLAAMPFYFGINDVLAGDYQTGAAFNRNVMSLFASWPAQVPPPPRGAPAPSDSALAQASIARGEQLFNTRPFPISGVAGLNDVLGQPVVRGSCSTCHDSPNVGTQSVPRLMNTGVAAAGLRTPDLPLYTLRDNATGATVQTSDPGRALVTGKWADVSKFKVPNLRGLAARAPYFHNGAQADVAGVLRFYDKRFQMGLTPQEVADLTAFLQAL